MRESDITDEFISHLEWLARIRLNEEERLRLRRELALLLKYINDVLDIDVDGYDPYIYPKPSMELREDVPVADPSPLSHLEGALLEDGFVKGPKVVKG